jgi:hypothetical protein
LFCRKIHQVISQPIESIVKSLFVPVDFSLKVFVKIFKNVIHRSYILTVKKSVTQSETCPETILNYKSSTLNEHGRIIVMLVEPTKLRKHG